RGGSFIVAPGWSLVRGAVDVPGGACTWRTTAEWEYAARAGTDAAFPGGGNLVTGSEHCEPGLVLDDGTALAAIAWYCATSGDTLHPAGTLTPNGWGLTDVCGNVYEWVHDWMTGYADTEPVDPWGPETGFQRLGRGGDTSDPPHHLRLGFRAAEDMIAVKRVGVRLARSAP
ncbi:MAG: SUMF1/EgtB/PvdO family nonheme iron enzyme, partial [Pseudomonadota bacterium]